MLKLVIPGKPIAQKRPRVTRNGTYDPQKQKKQSIRWILRKQLVGHEPLTGPLSVNIQFHLIRPKSSKRPHPTVKPDIDNYVKHIFDAGNGLIWSDDAIIISIKAEKVYAPTEQTIIEVECVDQ